MFAASKVLATTKATYSLRALVVKRKALGETDTILQLLTPQGRLDCVVRSGQNSRRWAGAIEPLTLIEGAFSPGRSLESLRECTVLSSFAPIKSDLDKLTAAGGWLQLASALSTLDDSAQLTFRAVVWALVELEKSETWTTLQHWLLLKLLQANGCCPSLEICSICSAELLAETSDNGWDVSGRQLLCSNCAYDLSPAAVRLEHLLLRYLKALSMSPAAVHSELMLPTEQANKIDRCLSGQFVHSHQETHEVFRKFPNLGVTI